MDDLRLLTKKLTYYFLLLIFLVTSSCIGLWIAATYAGLSTVISVSIVVFVFLVLGSLVATYMAKHALKPLEVVRQAILHVSSEKSHLAAPDLESFNFGRELVTALVMNVYNMASHETKIIKSTTTNGSVNGQEILDSNPLPIFTISNNNLLLSINDQALLFLGIGKSSRSELVGKNINDGLNLIFPSESTYESWISESRDKVLKATKTWNRVRLNDNNGSLLKQFDMAASYSKALGELESIIILFDHTEAYSTNDQEINFVAMAVHELRTPLTIMRGYIEVFEDELGPTLNPELTDFMHKMNASAQQLNAFVSNILNVARVEENQLVLTLLKYNLQDILPPIIADLQLRAQVRGKQIVLTIDPITPPVAVDRISLNEIINNLVDNAIKYGEKSDKILVNAYLKGDMIQIDVQDFGAGIPDSVVPKLFDKYYRSHRSKVQIGGTGLGLYLSKAMVLALGGNIWVNSHEGKGSVFSFTLEQYAQAKHGTNSADQDAIMRGAHGWIKNHSMYRK